MKIGLMSFTPNKQAMDLIKKATQSGLKDTIVDISNDAIKDSPILTGNNRRLIKYEVSGLGLNEIVNPTKEEAAIYSASGYGGYIETGTANMDPRPYMKPALDRHSKELAPNIKRHMP